MTPRKAEETRENFEAGKVNGWTAGEYGHTARVFREHGRIKLRYQRPDTKRPTQKTLFEADTRETRVKATAVAVAFAEKLRAGQAAEKTDAPARPKTRTADDITVYDIALLFMQRVPGFDPVLFSKTRGELTEWYAAHVKQGAPVGLNSFWTYIYGFRRLWRDRRFAPDRKLMDLEPADATTYAADWIASGKSPRTAVNDLDRFSCAIRYVMQQYRRTIAIPFNPIDGRKVDRSKARIPAFTPEEAKRLRAVVPELAARGVWQIFVAVGVGSSGRRLGSLLGLKLNDHNFRKNEVTWRADSAKGGNYDRGDEVRPMTSMHRSAVEWARKHYPNPLGGDAPLIWQKKHPSRPCPQPTLWKQLVILQKAAGVQIKSGRSWHSFRRMMATVLADAIGDGPASEFIGMTPETLRRYNYKQVQTHTMRVAAESADRILTGE